MLQVALLVLLPLLCGLLGGAGPFFFRWLAQRRCAHNALAVAPNGHGMCLDCCKKIEGPEWARRMGR